MHIILTPLSLVYFAIVGLFIFAIAIVWPRHSAPGGRIFAWLLVAGAWWTLLCGLERATPSFDNRILFAKLEYFGIVSTGVLWLLFTLQYTQHPGWSPLPRRSWLLWIIPAIMVALALTNEAHHLIWTKVLALSAEPGGPVIYYHGLGFWLEALYNYLLFLAGSIILIRALFRFPALYRRQTAALLTGLALPWVANALYFAGVSVVPGMDLTPIAFAATSLVYTWAIFGFRLFNLVPVARDLLVENMLEGILVIDVFGHIAEANPRAADILSMPLSALTGRKLEETLFFWPELLESLAARPDEADEFEAEIYGSAFDPSIQEAYRAGSRSVATRPIGSRILGVRANPIRQQDGRIAGRLIVLQDITARKQSEQQLRLTSVAMESASNGIMITQRDGAITWVNPAFTQMTGYSPTEAIGKKPSLLKSGLHEASFYQNMWDTILSGKAWHGELINRRKDGTLYIVEESIAPVFNGGGQVNYFISIKQDISERKRLEKTRDDLIHTMVHDLRNPLTNMGLALRVIEAAFEKESPQNRDILLIAMASVERMSNLVNSILDINRLESGQMPLDCKPVSLVELAGKVFELQKFQAADLKVSLVNNIPPDMEPAYADPMLIGRVLQNLVDNAISVSPEGTQVSVVAVHYDNGLIKVSVSDCGPGISPEMRERLFQKFASTKKGRGTGLGLTFCRLAVEAHGGEIWAEEHEGPGAIMSFTLKVAVTRD